MASKTLQINTLNIFLIFVSLILAYIFPFELFLLAYAILGPLHYVTEINWLDKKGYFVKNRKQVWVLVLMAGLIAIPFSFVMWGYMTDPYDRSSIVKQLSDLSPAFAFAGFFTAAALVFTRKVWIVLLVLAISLGIGILLNGQFGYAIMISGLLPTILHVFVFTFFFMLYGAMKDKSSTGIIAALIMLVIPFIIIYIPLDVRGMEIGKYFQDAYIGSKFYGVSFSLGWLLGVYEQVPNPAILTEVAVKLQVFIAFAYTYHYLNWFSKTTVIGWHKVIDRKRLFLLGGIWIFAVAVYMYNYYIGFILLLFLSYLHVLLEFPLNWVSFKGVFTGLFSRNSKAT